MKMLEISIEKVEGGYKYAHRQHNGIEVATDTITAFDALRSVLSQIEEWEKEDEEKQKPLADLEDRVGIIEKEILFIKEG